MKWTFAAAGAAVLLIPIVTSADQLPHRKPGLWQVTTTLQGARTPPAASKMCIDAQTESTLMNLGQNAVQKMCSKNSVVVRGNVATMDSVCTFGKTVMTSHSTATFADATFRNEMHVSYNPPLFGKSASIMTQDGKWMGACPPDMKPGDMILPGGIKMHLGKSD